ncbi:MAG: molybdopterin-dependent oxidoreductase [Actinomycetota bacterium]|nr:molybdopterin-dependent oxidoreductase [Actinomycetota bacterium]
MTTTLRAATAGIVGAVLAFGLAELIHGLFVSVPSVFVSLAQQVVERTPGELVTRGIELLGTADIPVLVACMIVGALVVTAILGNVAVRSPILAIAGVAVLAGIAIFAALAEPFVAAAPTALTIVGALAIGAAVTELLLRTDGVREPKKPVAEDTVASPPGVPPTMDVRSKEAYSSGGTSVGRGSFLLLGGGAMVAGLAALGVGRSLSGGSASSAPKRLNLASGTDNGENAAEGGSQEQAVEHQTLPPPDPEASLDVPGMPDLITPASNFYLIDTALTSPRIDVNSWNLSIKGEVKNPIQFSYKDLLEMPTREADVTLSCVSNEVGGGLISNGRWTGVLLSDVLAEAGVTRDKITSASEQLVGRSADGWTSGFKTDIALDGREALVAFGLNDSELPLKNGYPVRLVIPGLYGYVSATKWITEIELTNWDFDAYWIQRTWAKEGPIKTQSRMDTVQGGDNLSPGTVPIGGVAWAPHRGISKVEVSTDNGETWNEARLAAQLAEDTWRQYVYEWDAKPGDYTLQVRATDGEGQTQTEQTAPPHPSGASGYHTLDVAVA